MKKLTEDKSLMDRTVLPVDTIMELVEYCMKNCLFKERYSFFIQEDGLLIGSPLPPASANIYMEWVDGNVIKK